MNQNRVRASKELVSHLIKINTEYLLSTMRRTYSAAKFEVTAVTVANISRRPCVLYEVISVLSDIASFHGLWHDHVDDLCNEWKSGKRTSL